jgi:hypothetical protein
LRAELAATKAELARSEAVASASEAMIAGLKLEIALLKREKYGRRSERAARLIDQMELRLEELESAASEDAIRAEKTTKVKSFERRKPVRKTFPEHLPRERVVIEAPTACSCCGSSRLRPRAWCTR